MTDPNLLDLIPSPRTIARRSDPETSREAASRVASVGVTRRAILSELAHRDRLGGAGATDPEILTLLRLSLSVSDSGARTRRAELVRLGFVEDSGVRRLTSSGRRSVVWRITEAGRALIADEGGLE